jgi:hypothetical protein
VHDEETVQKIVTVLSSSFDNQMSVDQPFVVGVSSWANYKGAAYYSSDTYGTAQWTLRNKLSAQYAVCRRRFRVTLPVDGFAMDKLVTMRGKVCTIEAADVDLKMGRVTVTLLEGAATLTSE